MPSNTVLFTVTRPGRRVRTKSDRFPELRTP